MIQRSLVKYYVAKEFPVVVKKPHRKKPAKL
jgi:hypothetical protein